MIRIEAMDALRTYGKQAIDSIAEFINSPGIDNEANTHALIVIETIKSR